MGNGNALRRLSAFIAETINDEELLRAGQLDLGMVYSKIVERVSSRRSGHARPIDTLVIHSVFPAGIEIEQASDIWVHFVLEKPIGEGKKNTIGSAHSAFLALCKGAQDKRWREAHLVRDDTVAMPCLVPEFADVQKRLSKCSGAQGNLRLKLMSGSAMMPARMSLWDALASAPHIRGQADDDIITLQAVCIQTALESAQEIWRRVGALGLYPPDWAKEFDENGNDNFLSASEARILRGFQLALEEAFPHPERSVIPQETVREVWSALARRQAEHNSAPDTKRNIRLLPKGFADADDFRNSELGQSIIAGGVPALTEDPFHDVTIPEQPAPEELLSEGPEQARKIIDLMIEAGDLDPIGKKVVDEIVFNGRGDLDDLLKDELVGARFSDIEQIIEFVDILVDQVADFVNKLSASP